jgi:glycosyltransferase involved in cell wall biosynthesis
MGWSRELHAAIAKAGLTKHFVFLNEINYDDLPTYYSAADIVVYPSRFEGFGLPALEALACEVPLVCTDTGEMPYFVNDGQNGKVIKVGDVPGLQTALEELMDSSALRGRIAGKARQSVLGYSWDSLAQSVINLHKNA